MSDFPDPTAFTGRIGTLTVIGETNWWFNPSFRARFSILRSRLLSPKRRVRRASGLSELDTLYALRWSHHRIGEKMCLIFETIFLDDWEAYLRKLVATRSTGINLHATGALGYPGLGDVEVFLAFLSERHRPAGHLWARSPYSTIKDLRGLERTTAAGGGLDSRVTPQWFGSIVDIPDDRVGSVLDVLSAWQHPGPSGFSGPCDLVHHGRAVPFNIDGKWHLLLSFVHVAQGIERGRRRQRRPHAMRALNDLVDTEPWWNLFAALGSDGLEPIDRSTFLYDRRLGVQSSSSISFVDPAWERKPSAATHLTEESQ